MAGGRDISTPVALGIAAVAALLLAGDRLLLRPMPPEAVQEAQRPLVFFGADTVTRTRPGLAGETRQRAEAALDGAAYHAAYAEGPAGRSAVWTGAHTAELARLYALAACGEGCTVLAERLPQNAPEDATAAAAGAEGPWREEVALLPAAARRVGERAPYVSSGHALALGGAGAWGTGHGAGRHTRWRQAVRAAMAECNARLAAEPTPEGIAPEPCRYMSLRELRVEDRRPERPLYPAPYEVALSPLVPVSEEALRLVWADGSGVPGTNRFRQPRELHGARAGNGEAASGVIIGAGWPEAADALALALCEAERRVEEPACRIQMRRVPRADVPAGALAVTPEAHQAYREWQQTGGAGAFAIGPLGAWGMSYRMDDLAEARQRAADWCAYYSRRGNRAMWLRNAFVDQPPCRIVAERDG